MQDNKKQYMPALLDRLIDDHPKERREPSDKFYFDSRKMREVILRDLLTIFSTENTEGELQRYSKSPVVDSVINYGIAPLTGVYARQLSWEQVEEKLRRAILRFESRVIPDSLIITPLAGKDQYAQYGIIVFEIRTLVYWDPYPLDLRIKGSYDMETQQVSLNYR